MSCCTISTCCGEAAPVHAVQPSRQLFRFLVYAQERNTVPRSRTTIQLSWYVSYTCCRAYRPPTFDVHDAYYNARNLEFERSTLSQLAPRVRALQLCARAYAHCNCNCGRALYGIARCTTIVYGLVMRRPRVEYETGKLYNVQHVPGGLREQADGFVLTSKERTTSL